MSVTTAAAGNGSGLNIDLRGERQNSTECRGTRIP
jgi:hypothetical protein